MQYRRKLEVIEAVQMTKELAEDPAKWPDWLVRASQRPHTAVGALWRHPFNGVLLVKQTPSSHAELVHDDDYLIYQAEPYETVSVLSKHRFEEQYAPESEPSLDTFGRRSIHRVIRAMHDGECPVCRKISASDDMRFCATKAGKIETGWACPHCGFEISDEEAADGLELFTPLMKQNVEVFEAWRQARKKEKANG